jgi:hypothetical protein
MKKSIKTWVAQFCCIVFGGLALLIFVWLKFYQMCTANDSRTCWNYLGQPMNIGGVFTIALAITVIYLLVLYQFLTGKFDQNFDKPKKSHNYFHSVSHRKNEKFKNSSQRFHGDSNLSPF